MSTALPPDKLHNLLEYFSRISELHQYARAFNLDVTANQSNLLEHHPTLAVLYHIQTGTPIDEVINLHPEYYL